MLWVILVFVIIYSLYYSSFNKFKYNNYLNTALKTKNKLKTNTPPPFPNGWFKLLDSKDLQKKQVKYIECLNQNFAVFRGEDDNVYILDAYCPHLGANLAIGGTITGNCISCPFHGWKYSGLDGSCVNRIRTNDEPYDTSEIYSCSHENKCIQDNIQIKKWQSLEINDMIFVWHHNLNKTPEWTPKLIKEIENKEWEYRGETLQQVACHVQDIPENVADARHFDYVHKRHSKFLPIYYDWKPVWKSSTDQDIDTIFDDTNYKTKQFKLSKREYCEEPFTSVLYFENSIKIKIFNKFYNIPFGMKLIAFQVGPGLVYLFFDTIFGKGMFIQTLVPKNENQQELIHKLYTERKIPYIVTAFMLYAEAQQVLNDSYIWSNKIHLEKPIVCSKTDKTLIEWRKWYSQFYTKKKDLSW